MKQARYRAIACTVGTVLLLAGCVATAEGCDWPEVDLSDWSLVEATGFTMLIPPDYEYVLEAGTETESRFWRAGERTLKAEWGDQSVIVGGRREQWEGDINWQACELTIGGREVRVATYETQGGYFVVEAFWDDLPSTRWRTERIRPVLWIMATGTDSDAQREAVAIIRTVSVTQ
jgi:hypothetical protein